MQGANGESSVTGRRGRGREGGAEAPPPPAARSPDEAEGGRRRSPYREFLEILAAEEAVGRGKEPASRPSKEAPRPERLPRVFGRYTLLRERGRGALGVVYEAIAHQGGRKVAVKILRAGVEGEPGVLERFRREPGACAQIYHPNVVEVYESGEAEGRPFYAMELLAGESLAALIHAGRVPPARRLCRSLAGVADALHAMHQVGIVHRDVNPSNLIVEGDGRIVLADFGLARTAASISVSGTGGAPGTPLYMSPEQMRGASHEVDGRTDVYALGATLYEALTGRPVFATGDFETLAHLILTAKPRPPREFVPDLPAECESIVLKALEKRREDRPADAAALRDALLSIAVSEEPRSA